VDSNPTQFNRGVVRPFECLSEAWSLIIPRYWLFLGITLVGALIGGALSIVLLGPMMCGMFYCVLRHMRGELVRFEDLFKGFDYFLQSFIAVLIEAIPIAVVLLPVYLGLVFYTVATTMEAMARGESPFPQLVPMAFVYGGFILAVSLLGLIVGIFFVFTFPLIVDRKLSGVDAIKTSVAAAMANIGGVAGMMLLTFVLSLAGMLFCYVGVFFVFPITFTTHAVAYRRVFPAIVERDTAPPVIATS
jgi:uncharacterized membrane protein